MKGAVVILAACVAFPALADKKLADKKNCLSCHSVDQKVVGPAF
jgi:cytochrome c